MYNHVQFIGFQCISHSCTSIITINFRTFPPSLNETSCPLAVTPPFPLPSNPWQPLVYFPSLRICLFWTFHINGIMWYVAFCVLLLKFSIIFINIHPCCSIYQWFIPFYCQILFHCMNTYHMNFFHWSVDRHLG